MSPLLLTLALLSAADAGVLLARPVTVSGDQGTVLNREHRAFYRGHAKVVRDTTTITCDELELQYREGQSVERIIARGNVEAVDGERWARGDLANYENDTGVLTVTGHPEARQGKRQVAGEVVTFVTGTDSLLVTKARTLAEEAQGAGKPSRIAIDADTLTFEKATSVATWKGHVRARRGPTTLTAPLLLAHSDEAGTVTHVEARGGVEATEGDRWAKGRQADYDVAKGLLEVTGLPEARQGTTRLKGTRVVFRQGSDVIDVDNAVSVIEVAPKGKK